MTISGYYYLHTNGDLIYKPAVIDGLVSDFRESDLVRHFWSLDTADRENAWRVLVEASALGASAKRISELADLWQCNDDDAQHYARAIGIDLYMDGNAWCARRPNSIDLQTCPHGFGQTALEAMADLCRQLGFRAQKMWGPTFKGLVQCPCNSAKSIDAQCAASGECAV